MESVKHYITDMDGVLVKGLQVIPGASRFIARLKELGREYLVLTNNSLYTPRDLAHRLRTAGLEIPVERLFTSAMATADFLQSQRPNPGHSRYRLRHHRSRSRLRRAGRDPGLQL